MASADRLSYGQRLASVFTTYGSLCAGLDPSAEVLNVWGLTDDASGLATFVDVMTEAVDGLVGIVKPQVAFYERFGSAGWAVLEAATRVWRAAGLFVILDAKRGDIGSSMAGYAEACFAPGRLEVDAVTITPFLGYESLRPMIDRARQVDGGVFVLVRTSNPEGELLQTARTNAGERIDVSLLASMRTDNLAVARPAGELGPVGAVVGATKKATDLELESMGGPVLAPGLGFQGATVVDLANRFGPARRMMIPSSSRGILRHGPDVASLREAIKAEADACRVACA